MKATERQPFPRSERNRLSHQELRPVMRKSLSPRIAPGTMALAVLSQHRRPLSLRRTDARQLRRQLQPPLLPTAPESRPRDLERGGSTSQILLATMKGDRSFTRISAKTKVADSLACRPKTRPTSISCDSFIGLSSSLWLSNMPSSKPLVPLLPEVVVARSDYLKLLRGTIVIYPCDAAGSPRWSGW